MSGDGNSPTGAPLVFCDDAQARTFEPFALSRPFSEMRVGALLVRERWEFFFGSASAAFVGARHLAGFAEPNTPPLAGNVIPAGSILVNSRAAVALSAGRAGLVSLQQKSERDGTARAWTIGSKLAAVQLTQDLPVDHGHSDGLWATVVATCADAGNATSAVDVEGVWIDEVWDIIRYLTPLLQADIPVIAKARSFANVSSNTHGPIVTGQHALFVEDGATVEPFTYFDTREGPILVRSGSTVQAFTRVIGPCYIGRDCTVTADRITGSAIGDTCRVHGELSSTVFLGQSNKGHDGFVGHSIIGRWVNLGAGTTTSNLKNTYGTVALWTPGGVRDSGLQFLGTLFGDHVKTGIGLQLTTGCVLGTAANVFNNMPPKVVAPFAWGANEPYAEYEFGKFVETAARMMSRRHVELTGAGQHYLRAVYDSRWRVERA